MRKSINCNGTEHPKNAEPTAKAKLPPFVRGLLCIGTVLLVCFVVSIVLEVWYCKSAPNAAIKLAACLVLDAFAFLLPGVVATITAMHVIRKDKTSSENKSENRCQSDENAA